MDYDRITKERELYFNYSTEVSTQENYQLVYDQASDSVKYWASHHLRLYSNERVNKWFLDSLICFNKKVDKIIMVIAHQNILFKDIEADGLTYFYGVKIKESWYFFKGSYLALPRNFYQKDTKSPLSFSLLKAIAMGEIFKGYLKKNNGNGKWEINDAFFTGFAPKNQAASGYGSCFECKTEEEYYMYLVNQNWSDRDTTNYDSLQ